MKMQFLPLLFVTIVAFWHWLNHTVTQQTAPRYIDHRTIRFKCNLFCYSIHPMQKATSASFFLELLSLLSRSTCNDRQVPRCTYKFNREPSSLWNRLHMCCVRWRLLLNDKKRTHKRKHIANQTTSASLSCISAIALRWTHTHEKKNTAYLRREREKLNVVNKNIGTFFPWTETITSFVKCHV